MLHCFTSSYLRVAFPISYTCSGSVSSYLLVLFESGVQVNNLNGKRFALLSKSPCVFAVVLLSLRFFSDVRFSMSVVTSLILHLILLGTNVEVFSTYILNQYALD